MKNFYHFTCSHRAEMIGWIGVLRPNAQPILGGVGLVWLTDLAEPDVDGLGLTSATLSCDRTEFRYRATSHVGVQPWMTSPWRASCDPLTLADLESYGAPLHWFVSDFVVPVVRA